MFSLHVSNYEPVLTSDTTPHPAKKSRPNPKQRQKIKEAKQREGGDGGIRELRPDLI